MFKTVLGWKEILWNSWTTRLAAFLGVLAGVVGQNEIIAIGLLNFVPPGRPQLFAAAGVGFLVFALPLILARITQQPKLEEKIIDNIKADAEAADANSKGRLCVCSKPSRDGGDSDTNLHRLGGEQDPTI